MISLDILTPAKTMKPSATKSQSTAKLAQRNLEKELTRSASKHGLTPKTP